VTAGHLVVPTDGTTSGEIFPKLRAALRSAAQSRTIHTLRLIGRVDECVEALDKALAQYEGQ
jgi:hypothetical protein